MMRKLHPIDDRKTSSSFCIEHIFVFLAEFLEYKVDNFCAIPRIYYLSISIPYLF